VRISTYAQGDGIRVRVNTYPSQPPIGSVSLGTQYADEVQIAVDTPAEARAIAAAFEDMAAQLEQAIGGERS
jgi:hypothetical protein